MSAMKNTFCFCVLTAGFVRRRSGGFLRIGSGGGQAAVFAAAFWTLLAPCSFLAAQNTPPPPVPREAAVAAAAAVPAAAAGEAPEGTPLDPVHPDQLKRYSLDRYEKMIEKSPFAFKIVRAEGPPPISFAADLALAGFTVDSGKGVTYASIVDKKTNKRFVIRTDQPNADGIQLVQLNRGQTLLESAVMARKGSEEAEIKSDKQIIDRKAVVNAVVAGPGAAAAGGRPPQGGTVNLNLNVNRAAQVQAQINNQVQVGGQPGAAPVPQPAGLPPGAVPQAAGGTPPTAGDLSTQAAQPQAQPARPGQAPGRRRVILPPAVQN
jgi:hypothetical protein